MDKAAFAAMVDLTGLKLSEDQKATLHAVYPMFQAMVVRATPPMPRETEPSIMFTPEVK
jgi:hypothetical protein